MGTEQSYSDQNYGNRSYGTSGSTPPSTGMAGGMPPGAKISDYLPFSIFVTLCCCLPFGIVGIVFSSQARTKLAAGDFLGAQSAAHTAKIWTWIGFCSGMFISLFYFAAILVGVADEMGSF